MDYQDVLAQLGASTAHPGGFAITKRWCQAVDFEHVHDVLEVGCGTGHALTHVCATHQCRGTGVDIRQAMIHKARQRTRVLGISDVLFQTADAAHLPFSDGVFDLVFTESVNVFMEDPQPAIDEYFRVLKPGGVYVDVEMLVLAPVGDDWRHGVEEVYGAKFVPAQKGWKKLYQAAGFSEVLVLTTQSVNPMAMAAENEIAPTDVDLASPGAYQHPEVLQTLQANSDWMQTNAKPLGFGVFISRKAP